jgi:rubrerythrin
MGAAVNDPRCTCEGCGYVWYASKREPQDKCPRPSCGGAQIKREV